MNALPTGQSARTLRLLCYREPSSPLSVYLLFSGSPALANALVRMQNKRPYRCTLPDFAGRPKTLSSDFSAWDVLKKASQANAPTLLLGLGPGTTSWPASLESAPVYWLEEPNILRQTASATRIPASWQRVSVKEAIELFASATVWFYRQGFDLSPFFWSRLLGQLFAQNGSWQQNTSADRAALLLGDRSQLLHTELALALSKAGFTHIVESLSNDWRTKPEQALETACKGLVPDLCLAVNGKGLDSDGRLFGLLTALKVPCALWFVDSPWHILSQCKRPWWKKATLFVTDSSFIPDLRKEGAHAVHHLPLAYAEHMWCPLPCEGNTDATWASAAPLFVGHSAFPEKEHYFAAAHVDPKLENEALALLYANTGLPDIHWWYAHYHPTLWPGVAVRIPGAGAERCSQAKRVLWLQTGIRYGLRIVGDSGWTRFLPNTPIAPPVDYYTALPKLYYAASCVVNVTSLLLPNSVNQRHFDVWAAGGFLFSDKTEGLALFPEELTRPITLASPRDLGPALTTIDKNPSTLALRKAWRELLRNKHSYRHRLQTIRELLG